MASKRNKVSGVIFAAGKSSRMGTGGSKMLVEIERDGQKKPMIQYTTELLQALGVGAVVLVGYDGTAVSSSVLNTSKRNAMKCVRVSSDDGSDLEPNTAGHLKKYTKQILAELKDCDNILLCVGDQPFMQLETLRDFVSRHLDTKADASILLADVKDTPLEKSTSTRVSVIGAGRMAFDTPPKGGPFEGYSSLMDAGVVLIRKPAFLQAVRKVKREDVFSKLLCFLPPRKDRINVVRALNPYQFMNVNELGDRLLDIPKPLFPPSDDLTSQRFVDKSEILLRWLEWNILESRRTDFNIFAFSETYSPEFEIDTTLLCRGTPACAGDCTFGQKHMKVFLDPEVGTYVVKKAKSLGFSGVLFSGGGENLEEEAYANFLGILKTANDAGLRTNLATRGGYKLALSPVRIQELIFLLDSIRFSIPPMTERYSHLGMIGATISHARKLISNQFLPTKLYANFLMTPKTPIAELEADIRQVSQLGVNGIRFKAQHEYKKGRFVVTPEAYRDHTKAIKAISEDKELKLPEITISKLERMIHEPIGVNPFKACWYRDFNPLVLGCDGHAYACCETKYEKAFDYGDISLQEDNLQEVIKLRRKPQMVNGNTCFRGCKGYLVNVDLQLLLNEFETRGRNIFDDPKNLGVRDRLLKNLVRTVLTN